LAWAAWLPAPAAAAAPAPEPGVVQVDAAGPAQDGDGWAAVEDARGTTRWPQALQGLLVLHPHGRSASRALRELAALPDDLAESAALLGRARDEGADSEDGTLAALALARLDYAQDRPESALLALDHADAWPRPAAIQDEWLYWRAQCHLVLKGYRQAREDLRRLLTIHPKSPRAEAALAARAECDAACKDDADAEAAWTQLAQAKGAFAAQALWGLAGLRQRQGRLPEAQALYRQLLDRYPASFEAQAAPAKLDALARTPAKPQAPPAKPAGQRRWWVQVGAFSREAGASKLSARLRARHWKAVSQSRSVDGQRLVFVKVGPYKSRGLGLKAAAALKAKEKLDPRLVEE
jgi:tetratricopeptide (TPR) repeat protein